MSNLDRFFPMSVELILMIINPIHAGISKALSKKSVQSALSNLKCRLNVYRPIAFIGLSLLNSILMARFLKQSFAQTCLKETDNGKLQQFNYSRSLITNRGTVKRGKIHSARAMAKWEFFLLENKAEL